MAINGTKATSMWKPSRTPPKKDGMYFVCIHTETDPVIDKAWFVRGRWEMVQSYLVLSVAWWMEIPELPDKKG